MTRMNPRFRRVISASVMLAVSAAPGAVSTASDDVPFASYVPSKAGGFIRMRSVAAFDTLLGDLRAGILLATLTGAANPRAQSLDWSVLLERFLGPDTPVDQTELLNLEAAIALDSWHDPAHMVWFFRLKNPSLVDSWFPQDKRTAEDRSRTALMFRTNDGLIVALRDDVLVLTRRWVGDRLLIDVMQMLTGRPDAALQSDQRYNELLTYLPPNAVATLYVAEAPDRSPLSWVLGGAGERALAGVYGDDQRVDVAIRGTFATTVTYSDVEPDAVGQLMRLPRTTLFAMVQARSLDPRTLAGTGTSELLRFARLLVTMGRRRGVKDARRIDIGPHVVAAWGQSISSDRGFPELALMIECSDAPAFKQNLDAILNNVLATLHRAARGEADVPLAVGHQSYLGIPISVLPQVEGEQSDSRGMLRILTEIQPTWAAWGDWIILASCRSHLERILDAQFGLVPTLGSLPEAQFIRSARRGTAMLALAQTSDVAQQIDAWLEATGAASPPWLASQWWDSVLGIEAFLGPSLGIKLHEDHQPGGLRVKRTIQGTAGAGRLRGGDLIVGLNGRTLDLAQPQRDFRRQWRARDDGEKPVLRVLRDGTFTDVTLEVVEDNTAAIPEYDPEPWLRQLGSIARAITFGNVAVHVTDDRHYSARITLRK